MRGSYLCVLKAILSQKTVVSPFTFRYRIFCWWIIIRINIILNMSAQIRYHQFGQGPVLIFVPGANGTGDIFLPLAEQLKSHFTVVALDRRDYGESERKTPLPTEAQQPDDITRVKQDAADFETLVRHLSVHHVYFRFEFWRNCHNACTERLPGCRETYRFS